MNLSELSLARDAWQECMTDEQMEEVIQKYLSSLKKKMLRQAIKETVEGFTDGR